MMQWPPIGVFEAKPIVSGWGGSWPASKDDWKSNSELQNQFGVALAKGMAPFLAACEVFRSDTNKALWVSHNWLNDPVVIAARDIFLKNSVQPPPKLLDKETLAARVMQFAENSFVEDKERLGAFKLYADICGYTGKIDIDASTKNFTNNVMKLVLVKANNQNEPTKTIEPSETLIEEKHENALPLNIKLVR